MAVWTYTSKWRADVERVSSQGICGDPEQLNKPAQKAECLSSGWTVEESGHSIVKDLRHSVNPPSSFP